LSDEDAFLQAILHAPNDTSLRLVFADWLEERGDPRSELLRLLHALTQSVDVSQRKQMEERLRSLLASGVRPVGPFVTNSIGMKFALIPPGTFMMGSPNSEAEREDDETEHKVTLTNGFFMGVYTVTQEEWEAIMGTNPSSFRDKRNLPVENVSWDECQRFIKKLREQEKHQYRLPTEAEWEYCCRAGTTTPFFFGETIFTDQANYSGDIYGNGKKGEFLGETTPVGSFPANAFGLHDMHGNVCEWCQDWLGDYPQNDDIDPQGADTGEFFVLRGGSWRYDPQLCRSARRSGNDASSTGHGFRVCCFAT